MRARAATRSLSRNAVVAVVSPSLTISNRRSTCRSRSATAIDVKTDPPELALQRSWLTLRSAACVQPVVQPCGYREQRVASVGGLADHPPQALVATSGSTRGCELGDRRTVLAHLLDLGGRRHCLFQDI